jgi:hypothetical protein
VIDRDEQIAVDVLDSVINRIFGCGLALATVLNTSEVDGEVAEQLLYVREELDLVVADIRRTAFAPVVAERDARVF